MGAFSFPKHFHLQRSGDFRRVFDGGEKKHARGFVIFSRPNAYDHPRLGLSIGRKYGKAVRRNRMKRLIREAVRLNWRQWQLNGTDLIVIAKKNAGCLLLKEITADLSKLFHRPGAAE